MVKMRTRRVMRVQAMMITSLMRLKPIRYLNTCPIPSTIKRTVNLSGVTAGLRR